MEAATQPQTPPPEAPEAEAPQPAEIGETAAAGESEGRERGEDGRLLSREAARYRTALRQAESDRDQLRERLDRVQRAEVERLASGAGLAVAGDVSLHGANLDTLRTDEGDIDPETVSGLVDAILHDRPGLRAPKVGSFGLGVGGTGIPQPQRVGLSSLLKPGS
jgi:hypothetical protein